MNKKLKNNLNELEKIDEISNNFTLTNTFQYKKFNEAYDKFIKEKAKKEKSKKRKKTIFIIILLIILIPIIFYLKQYYDTTNIIEKIALSSYDYDKQTGVINVNINNKVLTKNIYCSIGKTNENLNWIKANSKLCQIPITKEEAKYVYIKVHNKVLEFTIPSMIIKAKFNDEKEEYLPLNSTKKIDCYYTYLGEEPILEYKTNEDIITVENNSIRAKKEGTTTLELYLNGKKYVDKKITVTSLIVTPPKHFNENKKYLTCNRYNKEQANLLDKLLFQKIDDAGYKTRAGVVEAARFLTLSFPYRIHYFFENGRLNSSGVHLADGEGRYYHRGLYLNSSKFKDLKYTFAGPSIWGCPLTNFEDFGPYVKGEKMPNGLDCSGFVTWALLNGGFDVGDYGAGETPEPNQMTDLGERKQITKELVKEGRIKPGDLLNWWGHIALIIGIDDNTYYVAESLDTYKGLVVKEYKKNTLHEDWTFVMLMDKVYKKDGNLTNMWY